MDRPDGARDALYERIWREAAGVAGVEIEKLAPGLFELRCGRASTRVSRHMVDVDDPVTLELARDRDLTHRLLAAAGVRIADRREPGARDSEPAPASAAAGGLYRLLLLDGELVDAALISPTQLAAGRGGVAFHGEVCPELLAEARSAQSTIGLRFAGIDVITTDLSKPLAETGGAIGDVRGAPELHALHRVADPEAPTRVAAAILRQLLGGTGREFAAEDHAPPP